MSAEHLGPKLIHAYIVIKVENGQAPDIATRLRERIPDAEVHVVDGSYDIVVEVNAEAEEYLSAMARDQIRVIPAITAHEVMIARD